MKTLKTLLVALAAALLSTGCFEKVNDRTEYLLKPLVQYTSGGPAEPLGEVVAYAFAADTAAWGVASYEDALAGILTAKENPAERIETPLATAAPCETEGMTDRIRMSLPAGSRMLLAVDTQHRLYAYTQQELVENLGTLYVSLVFKPWREGTAYQEKWSFYNPFYEPAPQLVCFVRAAAEAVEGGAAETIPSLKAYAFAADTTEWRIASYDDAVSGILTSKSDPGLTRDTPEFNAYESDEAGLYRFVADRSPLMLVVVDRTHKRYAYVKQEIDLTGESPTFDILFRLWQQGWIVEENGWRIVNPEEEPEPAPEPAPAPASAAAAGATRPTASETLPAAVRPAENQRP